MVVINRLDRSAFDFDWEARLAAVNEVCSEDPEKWKTCSLNDLCPGCEALAHSFKLRLIKAYAAGRRSAASGDVDTDLPIIDVEPVVAPAAPATSDIGSDVPGGGAS